MTGSESTPSRFDWGSHACPCRSRLLSINMHAYWQAHQHPILISCKIGDCSNALCSLNSLLPTANEEAIQEQNTTREMAACQRCWSLLSALLLLALQASAVDPGGKPESAIMKGGMDGRRHGTQRMWAVGKFEHQRPAVEALHKMEGSWNHTLPPELLRRWAACDGLARVWTLPAPGP